MAELSAISRIFVFANIPEELKIICILIALFILPAAGLFAQEGTAPVEPPPPDPTASPAPSDITPVDTSPGPVLAPPVRRKPKPMPVPPPPPADTVRTALPAGNNPFDIRGGSHASAALLSPDTHATPARSAPLRPGNPFDLDASGADAVGPEKRPLTPVQPSVVAEKPSSNAFVFGLILGMLALLSAAVSLNRYVLRHIYRAFINESDFRQALKDKASLGWTPFLILYFFFFVSAGIFLYLLLNHFGLTGSALYKGQWVALCILGVAAVFSLKHLVVAYTGFVFPVGKESSSYHFLIVVFGIILGLVLVPVNIFLAFVPADAGKLLIWLGLALTGGLYIFRTFRALMIASRFLTFHKLHFLLYLCAVELGPLMIVTKLIYQHI